MVSYFSNDFSGEVTNFQKEISNMMHGFGDNPNPNAATVVLIEDIVLQQLTSMLRQGLEHSEMRGAKTITNYDIIYLVRKNPIILRRLQEYQTKLDRIDNSRQATQSSEAIAVAGVNLDVDKESLTKTKRNHVEIIQEFDEFDEVSQVNFDMADYIRKLRAAKITESMSFEKYEAYHRARCSSFRNGSTSTKGFAKLQKWLNPNKELRINILALEVLSFLAYETVAEIVDAVFLIRQDNKKKSGDPFSKFEGGFFCNPYNLSDVMFLKTGYEGVPAITVAEVREVLRRYFMPGYGMNGLFYRRMGMDLSARYIAM